MKRFLSMALVVVLVLAMGAVTQAAEGTLVSDKISADINVQAIVGPYAMIKAGRAVNFGTLLGKVGVYTANGIDNTPEQFFERSKDALGYKDTDELVGNNNGYGTFEIETNCDVRISLAFNSTNWLTSPTVFGVAKFGEPSKVLAWAGNKNLEGFNTSFDHDYEVGVVQYGIDGAIYIQSISQQKADSYSGVLTITVEAR